MAKLLSILAALALLVGVTGIALAADDDLPHSGRVLLAFGGDLDVPAGEQADLVVVLGGTARIEGDVNVLVVGDGVARTEGATIETLAVFNGTAELGSGTVILGDVHHLGSTINRAEDVEVGGSIRDLTGDMVAFGVFAATAAVVLWIGFGIATLLFGLLAAGLAARQLRAATALIRAEPGMTLLVGLLSIILPPVVAVMLMATLIGIPAGLGLLVVLWPAVAFIGYVVAAVWLGEWLLGRRRAIDETPPDRPYGAALVGLAVAFVISIIPPVAALLSLLGLGAVVLAAWRTLRRPTTTQPTLTPQAAPLG